jgi:ribosome recycling factor
MSTLNEVIDQLNDQLEKNLQHTATEFSRIRAGKASPAMLESVMVFMENQQKKWLKNIKKIMI